MEIQDSMRKLSAIQHTSLFCLIRMPFQILYIHMYDYMKDKITSVINIM